MNDLEGMTPEPVARDWAARELSLPLFPGMTEDELERVVTSVNGWSGDGDQGGRSAVLANLIDIDSPEGPGGED